MVPGGRIAPQVQVVIQVPGFLEWSRVARIVKVIDAPAVKVLPHMVSDSTICFASTFGKLAFNIALTKGIIPRTVISRALIVDYFQLKDQRVFDRRNPIHS